MSTPTGQPKTPPLAELYGTPPRAQSLKGLLAPTEIAPTLGGEDQPPVQAPPRTPKPSKAPKPAAGPSRSAGRNTRSRIVHVPADLKKLLDQRAEAEQSTLTDVTLDAIEALMSNDEDIIANLLGKPKAREGATLFTRSRTRRRRPQQGELLTPYNLLLNEDDTKILDETATDAGVSRSLFVAVALRHYLM